MGYLWIYCLKAVFFLDATGCFLSGNFYKNGNPGFLQMFEKLKKSCILKSAAEKTNP